MCDDRLIIETAASTRLSLRGQPWRESGAQALPVSPHPLASQLAPPSLCLALWAVGSSDYAMILRIIALMLIPIALFAN